LPIFFRNRASQAGKGGSYKKETNKQTNPDLLKAIIVLPHISSRFGKNKV